MSVMKKTKLFSFFFALLMFFSLGATFIKPAQAASQKQIAEGSVLNKIKKSGELVVGTSADYPPLEFTASENGKTKYVGVDIRSEEHTSELQSRFDLVCRLLLEKKKNGSVSTKTKR